MLNDLIHVRWVFHIGVVAAFVLAFGQAEAAPPGPSAEQGVSVLEVEGVVEFSPPGEPQRWHRCSSNEVLYAGYQLRTGPRSRATIRLADLTVVSLGAESDLKISPEAEERTIFNVFKGLIYFFRRGQPAEYRLRTPTASTVARGTEFSLRVSDDGTTEVTLFDGALAVSNAWGEVQLTSEEAARVAPRAAPKRTFFVEASTVLQWRLYYPAVLDLAELTLPQETQLTLSESVAAYQKGDLQLALANYPAERRPQSDAETVYLAALLLAVGQVEATKELLQPILQSNPPADANTPARLGAALKKLIATIKDDFVPSEPARPSLLATEWLAEAYYKQAHADLSGARADALSATQLDPSFSFAWARLAELEFSFGDRKAALRAVEKSLALAPRNAQALALKGFILAAQNSVELAIAHFEQAMAVDGALGNAWLGRGLCRIRRGHTEEGLLDLQTAAALEPQRAALRSYLGKAFNQMGDLRHAELELDRARELDPADPTPSLYAALLNQQRNRINEAVRDLARSQRLNDNRRIYRSKLLLDQDRAVRGANLAGIYRDAGLADVSVREAVRAVNADYANYSAHLFLANSYQPLRDPRQVNLRYETPWLNEYLLANLLAPVGSGTLSPIVSQEEYSRLFERDRFGISSATEYSSRGDWYQSGSQFGTWHNSGYAADVNYRNEQGDRPNEDLEQLTLSLRLKHELTPQDSLYLQAVYYDSESGDVRPYYDPAEAQRHLRMKENQEPLLFLGYHREWSPGSHTLLLAGRLQDTLQVDNPESGFLAVLEGPGGPADVKVAPNAPFDYESELELYTVEAQHIWSGHNRTLVLGGRYQTGTFDTTSDLGSGTVPFSLLDFTTAPVAQDTKVDFDRFSLYAYHHWQLFEPLLFTVGVSYDRIEYPENHRIAPISEEEASADQVSPKAGLIWTPIAGTTLRGAYTRSLGGVSLEQSFRLEPSQVGGFNQAFRSLIPEAVAGALAVPEFETYGVAWDQKFGARTYLGFQMEWLNSKVDQKIGAESIGLVQTVTQLKQELDYDERTLAVSLDRLVGDRWSFGVRYRLSHASLDQRIPEIPASFGPVGSKELEAVLQQVWLMARFNHELGWFAEADSVWSQQSNHGYTPERAGDDFWQFNLHGGYRFFRRHVEARVSLLNLTDQDYRLNPLNLTAYLPRERTLALSLRFSF